MRRRASIGVPPVLSRIAQSMSRTVAPPRVVNIADLRRLAQRRLPRLAFDYIDGGADDEITLRENSRRSRASRSGRAAPWPPARRSADHRARHAARLAVPARARSAAAGCSIPRGEIAAAKAAGAAGTAYILSTLSGCRLEDVKAATRGPAWYQVYLVGGRDIATAGIARAQAAGFSALVVTIDTAGRPDSASATSATASRNWSAEASGKSCRSSAQVLARPRWLAGFLADGGLMHFPNVVLPEGPMGYADVGAALAQSVVTWPDLRWIRDLWKGPIVVKGVHTGEDARQAIAAGARRARGVEPRRPSAGWRAGDAARAAGGPRGGERTRRGAGRRRHPARRRRRQGAVSRRARGPGRTRVRVRPRRRRRRGVARAIEILRTELVRTLKLLGCESTRRSIARTSTCPPDWRDPPVTPKPVSETVRA